MALDEDELRVVRMVQLLLSDERDRTRITPELIGSGIDKIVGIMPSWGDGLDRGAVIHELLRRMNLLAP